MANLLHTLNAYITPDLIASATKIYDEKESGISKAIGSLIPTILAGLLEKNKDDKAVSGLFNSISNFDAGILDHLDSLLGGGNLAHNDPKDVSGHLLGNLFGAKVPAITNAVAAFSGVKQSTASSLLGLAGPLVMGLLSKKIHADGLNLSGFVNLLTAEKNNIASVLPAGIGAVLGWTNQSPATSKEAIAPALGTSWLMPLLLLLGLGAAIAYYVKNCTTPTVQAPPPPIINVIDSTAIKAEAEAAQLAARSFSKKLASGVEIKGNNNGIENQLLAFIEDETKLVDKTTWFNFDHLNFKTGSADLDMDYSQQQLANIFEILQAYPKVKLKIGGYTDTDGDEKANKTLSQKRADNVKTALVAMGIDKLRLNAEGYGEQHPECPANDTPECKAKNRRIAVRVMEK